MTHPTPYALDCVALGEPAGPLEDHLRTCPECRAYMDERRRAPAIPPWLARRRHRWPVPLAVALAAAAAVLVLVVRPPAVRVKGPPAVLVYLKRGQVVSAWQPPAPIRPGDLVRLQVRAAGFAHVSVASLPSAGPPRVLYAGPLGGADPHWLPFSLQADAEGEREVLSVVLGTARVDPAAHLAAPAGSWATRLTMPKETAP
jgi:hypothetical protein